MKQTPPTALPDWAYFLDVDGTLLEIAARPNEVNVPPELTMLLTHARSLCNGALAVVSGRAIGELDRLFSLPQLPAAGQHGLEIRDALGNLRRHNPPPEPLQEAVGRLGPLQNRHRGLLLEDKGATLAVHYRQAPALGSYLGRLLGQLTTTHPHLRLQPGKYVYELKPAGFDKGTAIAELMATPPFIGRLPVFIGDDLTDEHGFEEVNRMGGLSIKVGKGPTCAHYRLSDVHAVRNWLHGMTMKAEPN
ncbi:MAG TPA: trehalose-phosphatase [Rhodocyclaceae bacterium]|jgi:trehalose 6-phosphate phosphatase|nr:trehalose-phosphatase [Rhodocyclaceae bacterium]